jgi:hypothetical protein
MNLELSSLQPQLECWARSEALALYWFLFHFSSIPIFHVGGIKPVSIKATCFKYVIKIPKHKLVPEPTMKPTAIKTFFLKTIILTSTWLLLWPAVPFATQSDQNQAPGRTMAQQATRGQKIWNTTDHTKHKALQNDFKSGLEVTQACLSCHSEAESQFHKSIHWTWLADPTDTDKQFGKAGNSLNNFCISTNKAADKGCLSCHPGWGTSMESGINCLVCHSNELG